MTNLKENSAQGRMDMFFYIQTSVMCLAILVLACWLMSRCGRSYDGFSPEKEMWNACGEKQKTKQKSKSFFSDSPFYHIDEKSNVESNGNGANVGLPECNARMQSQDFSFQRAMTQICAIWQP